MCVSLIIHNSGTENSQHKFYLMESFDKVFDGRFGAWLFVMLFVLLSVFANLGGVLCDSAKSTTSSFSYDHEVVIYLELQNM